MQIAMASHLGLNEFVNTLHSGLYTGFTAGEVGNISDDLNITVDFGIIVIPAACVHTCSTVTILESCVGGGQVGSLFSMSSSGGMLGIVS